MYCNESHLIFSEWMNSDSNPFGCDLLHASDTGTALTWTLTLIMLFAYLTQRPVISEDECGAGHCKVASVMLVTGFFAGVTGVWLYVGMICIVLLDVVTELFQEHRTNYQEVKENE